MYLNERTSKDNDMIEYMDEDTLYIDPQKYPVCNKFKGEGYSLLCKDLVTSAINQGNKIVRNYFYVVDSLTANRFSCSRCIQWKGDIKYWQLTLFCVKTFHNDAINSWGIIGKNESPEYNSKANRQWM